MDFLKLFFWNQQEEQLLGEGITDILNLTIYNSDSSNQFTVSHHKSRHNNQAGFTTSVYAYLHSPVHNCPNHWEMASAWNSICATTLTLIDDYLLSCFQTLNLKKISLWSWKNSQENWKDRTVFSVGVAVGARAKLTLPKPCLRNT